MKRILCATIFTVLTVHCVWSAESAFEVASITPCKPGTPAPEMEHTGVVNFASPGGRFTARATTVVFLTEWAYGIQPWQHSDGPGWIGSERFDIIAKADHDATENEMKLMARTLLAERFGLKMHRAPKEMPAYVISVGKNEPKLFPPKDGETHGMAFSMTPGADQKMASFRVIATRFALAELADVFARRMDRVVVNRTGMDGEFDFTLDLTPEEHGGNPMGMQSMFLDALRGQIGLEVRSEKTAVDYYVIDGAEKTGVGN
ncbi:MAG TPA: TIGR03435 family protein [Bryobacteraceae bacterium]|nr:TIGR03435 family protein [Bryobacteraceae bacterium]